MALVTDAPVLLDPTVDQYGSLISWVGEHPAARLLDLGAGSGVDSPYGLRLRTVADTITGVDPEEAVLTNPHLDHAVQATAEEFVADDRLEPFDAATACYVIEHLREPLAFLNAARSAVRPGGSLFLLTPNRRHYFGFSAALAARLHIQRPLLRLLRSDDDYHHAVAYRANTLRRLGRLAETAGFERMEARMIEVPNIFFPYFAPSLRFLPTTYSRLVHRRGWTRLAGTILVRLS
ncbi:MAG: class I SAM-dependent methyltransferase [Actinobacteria bacterium]|nr:class I SAM-dependent methyltransferase [Actinomycetota bacterium]